MPTVVKSLNKAPPPNSVEDSVEVSINSVEVSINSKIGKGNSVPRGDEVD